MARATALLAVALFALACAQATGADDAQLIAAVMKGRYVAGYLSAQQCWLYLDRQYGRYCVKPIKSEEVRSKHQRWLYLLTSGVPVRPEGAADELPVHASPGLVGAFAVAWGEHGAPQYLAATDALMSGSFGDSGAGEARLLAIGSDAHAWVFVSGGTWQGISVGEYRILTPRNGRFIDVSRIPAMREVDQSHHYQIEFDSSKPEHGLFALIVTRHGQGTADETERFVVPFNRRVQRYEMPQGR